MEIFWISYHYLHKSFEQSKNLLLRRHGNLFTTLMDKEKGAYLWVIQLPKQWGVIQCEINGIGRLSGYWRVLNFLGIIKCKNQKKLIWIITWCFHYILWNFSTTKVLSHVITVPSQHSYTKFNQKAKRMAMLASWQFLKFTSIWSQWRIN